MCSLLITFQTVFVPMSSTCKLWAGAFLSGLAELVFAASPLSGLLVAMGLTLISPWLLLGASLGALVGTALGRFTPGMDRTAWAGGLAGFNPAIIGLLWAGSFNAGFNAQVLFAVLLVICVLAEPAVRRITESFALLPFSAPALSVAILSSFALAPSGTWFWTGTTDRLFGATGVWCGLACIVAAMAIESSWAAAWAASFALAAYLVLDLSGYDVVLHAGLWGLTVPLSCFAAMTVISRNSLVSWVSGLVAVASGIVIWALWATSGLSDRVPPLIGPLIVSLWTATIVMRRYHSAPLLQSAFWNTLNHIRRANQTGSPVIALTGTSIAEALIFEEYADAARMRNGGASGATADIAPYTSDMTNDFTWELGDRVRQAAKTATPEPVHLAVAHAARHGMIDHIAAGDALGLLAKAGMEPTAMLAGQAGKVICLSCGAQSEWPPAALWRRVALRCVRCSGRLAPDLCHLASTPSTSRVERHLIDLLVPGAVVLAIGCDPEAASGSAIAAKIIESGASVCRLDHAAARPHSLHAGDANDPYPGKTLRLLLATWRILSAFDVLTRNHARSKSQHSGHRAWPEYLSPYRSVLVPWLAAAVLGLAVLMPEFISGPVVHLSHPIRADLASGDTGKIYFASHNSDIAQLEVGGLRGLPVTISAELSVPSGATEQVPAIVLMHGSLGLTSLQHSYADMLKQLGYAVLLVDSFGGRNITDVVGNQTAVDGYSMMIDAFAALHLLTTHPAIDPERIALIGWSKGGGVAQLAMTQRYRNILARGDLSFAAHVAIYPWCGEQEVEPNLTGAPILYLLADADDWVGPQACVDYARRIAETGYPAQWVVYANAEHGFDDTGQFRTFVSQAVGWGRCQYFARADGFVIADTGEFRPWSSIDDYLASCTIQGAHMATNAHARAAVVERLTGFLVRALR